MTVALTRIDQHNAKCRTPPDGGGLCNLLWKMLPRGSKRPHYPGRSEVRTKPPGRSTGEFVPMRKSRLADVITSSPANKTAARVVARGIHYEPPERLRPLDSVYGSDLPLIVNLPRGKRDLTGVVVGRLTVIGYLGDHLDKNGKSSHSRWLVRCLCGVYEHRKGAALRRLVASADLWFARCWECRHLEHLRGHKPPNDHWQDQPIPTVPLLPGANEVFEGGEKFGQLTVVGYGGSSGGKGARWVVRCDCGAYGLMSAAGLKRSSMPQCSRCFRAEGVRP